MAAVNTNIFAKVCWILLIPFIAASPLNKDGRIINGTTAIADNTHHQASIRMRNSEYSFGSGHVCGGSLIAPNVVVTAAHCFYDDDLEELNSYEHYLVVMGTLNRLVKTENTLSIDVADIVFNDFVRPTFENDIALLFLNGRVPDSNPAIKVIPLNREVMPVGTVCQVTGWGETEKGHMSNVLMTVNLPIIDSEICSTNYGEDVILDGMICAGFMEGEKDACQGDSGGPMVSEGKLVGIISFGDGCASPGFPGVYTDVRHYVDWIEDKLANASLTTVTPEDTTISYTEISSTTDIDTGLSDATLPGDIIPSPSTPPKGNSANMICLSSVVFLLGSLLLSSF